MFAGAGGGILGGILLGWHTVAAVEIEPYPRKVLRQRQKDGLLDDFPIYWDVSKFDGTAWRGKVDVISGGFPCQDISSAGKQRGLIGEKSGLWREYARIIREVKPEWIFAENSPALARRGLDEVLHDLHALGFDAVWETIGARHVGAPHSRNRLWVVAHAQMDGRGCLLPLDRAVLGGESHEVCRLEDTPWRSGSEPLPRGVDADLVRVADGMADRVDRLRALGNGQVPRVAAFAFDWLSAHLLRLQAAPT